MDPGGHHGMAHVFAFRTDGGIAIAGQAGADESFTLGHRCRRDGFRAQTTLKERRKNAGAQRRGATGFGKDRRLPFASLGDILRTQIHNLHRALRKAQAGSVLEDALPAEAAPRARRVQREFATAPLHNPALRGEARRLVDSVECRQIPVQDLDLEEVGAGPEKRAKVVGVDLAELRIAARGPHANHNAVHFQVIVEPGGQVQLGFSGNAVQIKASPEADAIHAPARPIRRHGGPDPERRPAGSVRHGLEGRRGSGGLDNEPWKNRSDGCQELVHDGTATTIRPPCRTMQSADLFNLLTNSIFHFSISTC